MSSNLSNRNWTNQKAAAGKAAAAESAQYKVDTEKLGIDKQPLIPTLQSIMTPSGQLSDKYKAKGSAPIDFKGLGVNALMADPRALEAMRAKALAPGSSAWARMALEGQGLDEMTAMDNAGKLANSQAAQGRSQLAMKGGLSAGASERAGMRAQEAQLLAQQGIGRAGQSDRIEIGKADEVNKNTLLGQVAGLDLTGSGQRQDLAKFNSSSALDANKFNKNAANQLEQYNTQNTIGGLATDNKNKFDIYAEQMRGFGAGQTAEATRRGGKK